MPTSASILQLKQSQNLSQSTQYHFWGNVKYQQAWQEAAEIWALCHKYDLTDCSSVHNIVEIHLDYRDFLFFFFFRNKSVTILACLVIFIDIISFFGYWSGNVRIKGCEKRRNQEQQLQREICFFLKKNINSITFYYLLLHHSSEFVFVWGFFNRRVKAFDVTLSTQ